MNPYLTSLNVDYHVLDVLMDQERQGRECVAIFFDPLTFSPITARGWTNRRKLTVASVTKSSGDGKIKVEVLGRNTPLDFNTLSYVPLTEHVTGMFCKVDETIGGSAMSRTASSGTRELSLLERWSLRKDAEAKNEGGRTVTAAAGTPAPKQAPLPFTTVAASDRDDVARRLYAAVREKLSSIHGGAGMQVSEKQFLIPLTRKAQDGAEQVKEAKGLYEISLTTPVGNQKKAIVVATYDADRSTDQYRVDGTFTDSGGTLRGLSSIELNKYASEEPVQVDVNSLVLNDAQQINGYGHQVFEEIPTVDLNQTVAALKARGFEVSCRYIDRTHGPTFGRHCWVVTASGDQVVAVRKTIEAVKAQKLKDPTKWPDRSLQQGDPAGQFDKLPFEDRAGEKGSYKKDYEELLWEDRASSKGGEEMATKAYGKGPNFKWMRTESRRPAGQKLEGNIYDQTPNTSTSGFDFGETYKIRKKDKDATPTAEGVEGEPAEKSAARRVQQRRLMALRARHLRHQAQKLEGEIYNTGPRPPGSYNQGETFTIRKRDKEATPTAEGVEGEPAEKSAARRAQMEAVRRRQAKIKELALRAKMKGLAQKLEGNIYDQTPNTSTSGFDFGETYKIRKKDKDATPTAEGVEGEPAEKSAMKMARRARIARIRNRIRKLVADRRAAMKT